jgi:hypothetical protein
MASRRDGTYRGLLRNASALKFLALQGQNNETQGRRAAAHPGLELKSLLLFQPRSGCIFPLKTRRNMGQSLAEIYAKKGRKGDAAQIGPSLSGKKGTQAVGIKTHSVPASLFRHLTKPNALSLKSF